MTFYHLLVGLCIPSLLFSHSIRELSHLKELFSLINAANAAQTMFIFDIDNTLLRPKQQLGSVAWGEYTVRELVSKGVSKEKAEEIVNILWTTVQPHISVETVDPDTPRLISEIQTRGIPLLFLTARTPYEKMYTHKQLQSIGINIESSCDEQEFLLKRKILFHKNVLFITPHNKKSEALIQFLEHNKPKIQRVVFVDDKHTHVEDVFHALKEKGIECIGIRFSGADEQLHQFNPDITRIQWEAFPKILSDEEAAIELRTRIHNP